MIFERVGEAEGLFLAAGYVERDQRAAAAHLPAGQCRLRVIVAERIKHTALCRF